MKSPTSGNDRIFGAAGNDVIHGLDGDDQLMGRAGNDSLYGDGGNDTLQGQQGNDLLFGGAGDDTLTGAADFDQLHGGDGNDSLDGGGTRDWLFGDAGNDVLMGGNDNDRLTGGQGQDSLSGGAGADVFIFWGAHSSADHALADVIVDFSSADHDRIDLHTYDAERKVDGNQAFSFIGDADFSHTAGELHYVQDSGAGMTYVEGDQNGDGHADFSIAVVGLVDFAAGDFML